MRSIGITCIALTLGIGLDTALAAPATEATLVPGTAQKWEAVPDSGGVQIAPLWGDLHKEAHGAMVQFPAGIRHPLHTHTSSLRIVIVSGNFLYGPEGGPEQAYGPGSYLMIPGGLRHTGGCTAAAPCILFQEGLGRFDVKPASPKG